MSTYLMASNGNDGSFWALNGSNQAVRFLGNASMQPESSQALTCIAVANVDTVYGLDAAGDLYKLVSTPFQQAPWAPIWHAVPGPDGSVWGVDGGGGIFQWVNGQWEGRPNGGAHALFVAVGANGNVWTIDNTGGWWGGPGVPYKWNGSTFMPVANAPNAQWISIAPDGTVWLQSDDNRTLYFDGSAWRVAATDTPRLFGISAGSNGQVYGWDFGLLYILGGGGWQPLNTPGSCASASTCQDGTVVADGMPVTRLAGFSAWSPVPVPGRTLDVFAMDAHKMYFLSVDTGRYLQWGGSTWQKIAGGGMASISAGVDGALWGVDAAQAVWSFDGANWQRVTGKMRKVSVGSSQNIVGLDPNGKIFYFDGGGWRPLASPTTGPMLDVAIGSDASLFAIDGANNLWSRIAPGDWMKPGALPLAQISAADRYHVCGVTKPDGSGRNQVWLGAGVAVGADHHLHHYFKAPGWTARQEAMTAQRPCDGMSKTGMSKTGTPTI